MPPCASRILASNSFIRPTRQSGDDVGDRSRPPVAQSDRRHFESISCLGVPGAFHAADEVELVRIDMLTPAIHDRFVLNMDEQNLSENQTETTEQNFLHQRAFHRNRGLRDARYANPLRWGESKPGLLGLFHTSWKRNRGNPHFPRASERRPEGEVYVDIKSRLQINNGFGIRYAALAGAGIVMQRAELVAEDIAAGRLQA